MMNAILNFGFWIERLWNGSILQRPFLLHDYFLITHDFKTLKDSGVNHEKS